MPVIRISDSTWNRLKAHARPLEDSADDVVRLALDALEASTSRRSPATAADFPGPRTVRRRKKDDRTPQRQFRLPLLRVLRLMGGAGAVADVRGRLEREIGDSLLPVDRERVSTGDPRWWNAVCWERADLVREGLLEKASRRGVWALSVAGRRHLFEREREEGPKTVDERAARWALENAEAIRTHNDRIAERGIFGEDLRRW